MAIQEAKGRSIKPASIPCCACGAETSAVETLISRKPRVWKRAMDLIGALFGLVLLSPLFLLIALYIKAISPGPVFFKQTRVGRGGRLFECIKFRTMKPNADASTHKRYLASLINEERPAAGSRPVMTKLHNDPQIIPFVNVLRESGLDELPQLVNVLRGEMSLIGPRPSIPYEVQEYKLWFRDRFDVQPGITGLWQVSGKNRLTFHEMIRLDIQYSRNVSFLLDIKILLLTPYAVWAQFRDYLNRKLFTESPSTIHSS
jgi:lipopolysaccharide/colanic/teichoic acid biosynthesis glycosyltransferase